MKIEVQKKQIIVRHSSAPGKIDRLSALRQHQNALLRFDRAIDREIQFQRKVAGNIEPSNPLCSAQTRPTKLLALRALHTDDRNIVTSVIDRAIGMDRDMALLFETVGWATIPTGILGCSCNDIRLVTKLLEAHFEWDRFHWQRVMVPRN